MHMQAHTYTYSERSWSPTLSSIQIVSSPNDLHENWMAREEEGLFVGSLTSQQHVSVSQGQICSDRCTCCHTEIEVADQTLYLTQSQCTDTGLTSHSADPIMTGTWQGSLWSANFKVSVSAQDGVIALGKAHARSAPSLSSLPKVDPETVPIFV